MMNDHSIKENDAVASPGSEAGERELDIPEELITLDGRNPLDNAWAADPAPEKTAARFDPCFVFPLAALALVLLIVLAALLAAPARFRLDSVPGVVRLDVVNSDGSVRTVPCDAEGIYRLRPGHYRFAISSGGHPLISKELTLDAAGRLLDGDVVLDFDRFAPRIVFDSGNVEAVPFVNGRRVEPVNRTARFPAGRYDVVFLAGSELSEVARVELPLPGDTIRIVDFPWRFRDADAGLYEKTVAEFFLTLYALEPAAWDAFALEKKTELLDLFYRGFCVPSTVAEPSDVGGGDSRRWDATDFERRLALVREKIRARIQDVILDLDAAGVQDPGAWRQLLRATAPWESEAVADWRFSYARSLAFGRLEQWSAAGAELEKSLRLAPENAMLRFNAGQVLTRLDRFDEARRVIREAMESDSSYENRGLIALAEIEVREIERYAVPHPWNTLDKSLEKALNLLNDALNADFRDAEAFYLRSLVYYAQGRDADSENDWREFEKRMNHEARSGRIEKELRRERWKEKFQDRRETAP